MKKSIVHAAVVAAIGSSGAALGPNALAQEGPLEEIVVTATRREVSMQDIPLAITALTEESLTMQNIENPQDLTAVVPNVLFYGSGRGITNGTFVMRGIPNVGTYVDGVWQVSNAGLLQRQFADLERVEVLRGPQGTLVGRDSTGGSVMVYTRPPQQEFGATIKLGAGSFDRRDVSASIDIPLTDNLLTRWTLGSFEKDGYVESVTTGINHGLLENQVFRGDILWTPGDKVSLRLIRQEDEQVNTTAGLQTFINYDVAYRFGWQVGIAEAHHIASVAAGGAGFDCQSQVAGCPGGRLGEYQSTKALTSPDSVDGDSTTLILDYDISDLMSFKYTYGNTEVLDVQWTDFAGAEFNFFTNYDVGFREFESHEIQFNFDLERTHVILGAFTWDQDERTRGTEWSHSDWSFPNGWGGGAGGSVGGPPVGTAPGMIPFPGFFRTIDAGIPQTLSYDDVLASPTCQRTPAFYGYDFSSSDPNLNPSILSGNGQFPVIDPTLNPNTVAGWPRPCNAFNSWVPLFATVVGFNGTAAAHDRGDSDHQEGVALFGDVTFDISDRWDVSVGFRYHDQDNAFYNADVAGGVAAGTVEQRPTQWDIGFVNPKRAVLSPLIVPASIVPATFNETTYRLATSYDIRDNVMLYAAYNEGFTAGGADQSADSLGTFIAPFDPEIIENFEFGMRADFADGRLRVNATVFSMDWVGVQAAQSVIDRVTGDPITEVFLSNASDATADGVEVEITFAATDNLALGAELGTLDTAYVNVKPTAQYSENTEFGGAPEETYNLWGQYDWGLGAGGMLSMRLSANYQGNFWRSSIVNFRPDVYGGGSNGPAGDIWRWNARAVYAPANGDWELAGFVNNITDEFYLNSGFMDSIWQFDFSGVDAPREYGVSLSMRF